MNAAVIGVGYWGPNLVRNFSKHPTIKKVYCHDVDGERLSYVCREYPTVEAVSNYTQILNNPTIESVVIATPVGSHFELAEAALQKDKHVLVEKPLTSNSDDAKKLVELALKKKLVLMVDHIFVYHGAVKMMKEIIDSGEIGEVMYFDAVRINLGLFQHDVNVIWDLATHDLSIMNYLLQKKPIAVSAVGVNHFNTLEDIAYITLFFSNSCIAHIHVNWLAPVKVRRILIGGTQKMIVFDDMETVEKIRVYDKGVDVTTKEGIYKTLIQYRTGDMYAPKYDTTEPLAMLTNEFISAIEQKSEPITNGDAGLEIVKILEAAEKSIKNKGAIIELRDGL